MKAVVILGRYCCNQVLAPDQVGRLTVHQIVKLDRTCAGLVDKVSMKLPAPNFAVLFASSNSNEGAPLLRSPSVALNFLAAELVFETIPIFGEENH